MLSLRYAITYKSITTEILNFRTLPVVLAVLCAFGNSPVAGQQVYLEREVIGGAQMDAVHQGTRFSGTLGEVVSATGSMGQSFTITQGFHQTKMSGPLRALVHIKPATCRAKQNGYIKIEQIQGCSGPYSFSWETGDTTQTLANLGAGNYTLSVKAEFCGKDFEFTVPEENRPCPLSFYNVITPDDDGKNDYWHIDDITLPYYQNNEVQIFNRWGRQVWQDTGYDNQTTKWDGKDLNHRELPAGTYFYAVEAGEETYKGYVEVIR